MGLLSHSLKDRLVLFLVKLWAHHYWYLSPI